VVPRAGLDYPDSYGEFRSWFGDDGSCLDYLDWLRWPSGFACPHCGATQGWRTRDGRWSCGGCARRVSATAGTIFHRTRTPLTVWFAAAWEMTSRKNGVSALAVQRLLGLGSYQTAWAMLHRLRSAMVRPGRERLAGAVEIDETFFGGEEPGLSGGRARGKKVLVGVAVEVKEPRGFGRCRLAPLADASATSLHPFVTAHVEPGTRVITDGWPSYHGIEGLGYVHEARSQRAARARGEDPSALLPAVHRVASLAKRWLLGTHQGAVESDHLLAYLNEFTFRFNRRAARAPGLLFYRLLEQAVAVGPITYRELVAHPRPDWVRDRVPGQRSWPATLDIRPAARPWRRMD